MDVMMECDAGCDDGKIHVKEGMKQFSVVIIALLLSLLFLLLCQC